MLKLKPFNLKPGVELIPIWDTFSDEYHERIYTEVTLEFSWAFVNEPILVEALNANRKDVSDPG